MGSCCSSRKCSDFHGVINTRELISLYNKELEATSRYTNELESSPKTKEGKEIRFLKIFLIKTEELKQKIAKRDLEEIEKIKEYSNTLFNTLYEKDEEAFRAIYLEILIYLKETKKLN